MVMCEPVTLKSGGLIFQLSTYDTCPSLTSEIVMQSKSYYQKFPGISGLKNLCRGQNLGFFYQFWPPKFETCSPLHL
jgi:hypothetical protein